MNCNRDSLAGSGILVLGSGAVSLPGVNQSKT